MILCLYCLKPVVLYCIVSVAPRVRKKTLIGAFVMYTRSFYRCRLSLTTRKAALRSMGYERKCCKYTLWAIKNVPLLFLR